MISPSRSLRTRFFPFAIIGLMAVWLVFSGLAEAQQVTKVSGKAVELVSAQTHTQMSALGQRQVVQDLAASGQLLVEVRPGTTAAAFQAALQATHARVLRQYRTPGLFLVSLPAGMGVNSGVQMWQQQNVTRTASPDRVMYATATTPNDPMYSQQYQWPLIEADKAWDTQKGSASTVIAVVDTGVDMTHPDLASKIWVNTGEIPGNGIDDDHNGYIDDTNGWDFVDNDNDPSDEHGHGTHCAGLAGAATNNGIGVAGHDWNCRIMPVRVLDANGMGIDSEIMLGYEYAVDNGANVISMSLGGSYDPQWTDTFAYGHDKGVVNVVAAGNDGLIFTDDPSTWESPVCNDGDNPGDNYAIGVGATDANDKAAYFTNLDASSHHFVDVMAPGVDIWSTWLGGGYQSESGTSMATPIVAGLAGLIESQYPGITPDALLAQMRAGCVNINSENPQDAGLMGAGRIDSLNSLTDQPPGPARNVQASDTLGDSGGSITVTWVLSADDGQGSDDVIGYDVTRATDPAGPFTKLASVAAGVHTYIDSPVPNYTDFYYQILTHDHSNVTPSAVSNAAQARDDTPPPAVPLTAYDTPADQGGSISLDWSSYQPPPDARTYHVYRAQKAFTTVSGMTPLAIINNVSQKSYQDQTTVDDTDYYYAVTALDDSQPPNELQTVQSVGPVRSDPNYSFSYPAGVSLMAIGLSTQEGDLGKLFDITGQGLNFARWDPTEGDSGAYHIYSQTPDDTFLRQVPGRGFWMKAPQAVVLNLSGAAAQQDVPIDFSLGWNELGNPYTVAVNVSDATVTVAGTQYTLAESKALGYTRDYFWTYDTPSASYKLVSSNPDMPFATQTIAKGSGFFFLAETTGQLTLPLPVASSTAQVAHRPSTPQPSEQNWTMRLVAQTAGGADTDNFLGVSPQAASISGIASPPLTSEGVDLYFTENSRHVATDFVQSLGAGKTWQVTVACAHPAQQVKLSWPDLSQLPNNCRPVLEDEVTGHTVYLRTTSNYTFTMGSGEAQRQFTLKISPKAGDLLAIQSVQIQAVHSGAQISYTLSAPAAVDVQIVNIAGRPVRNLQSGAAAQSGTNTALWDGVGDNGTLAPCGVYLVRITAHSQDGQSVSVVQALRLTNR